MSALVISDGSLTPFSAISFCSLALSLSGDTSDTSWVLGAPWSGTFTGVLTGVAGNWAVAASGTPEFRGGEGGVRREPVWGAATGAGSFFAYLETIGCLTADFAGRAGLGFGTDLTGFFTGLAGDGGFAFTVFATFCELAYGVSALLCWTASLISWWISNFLSADGEVEATGARAGTGAGGGGGVITGDESILLRLTESLFGKAGSANIELSLWVI